MISARDASACENDLGTGHVTKSDEFSEKFQMTFDPPPNFWKVILRFFATKL